MATARSCSPAPAPASRATRARPPSRWANSRCAAWRRAWRARCSRKTSMSATSSLMAGSAGPATRAAPIAAPMRCSIPTRSPTAISTCIASSAAPGLGKSGCAPGSRRSEPVCYAVCDMTPPFQQRFVARAAERSPLCVGIDPAAESLTGWGLADDIPGLRAFCERMVEACAPLVAVVKPQAAFFERHGPAGMEVLRQTVEIAQSRGALVIIDAKRGDISTTAAAYADAFLGPRSPFGGDAMTLSAYLGLGSLAPFFEVAQRDGAGVFVVVRSSNPEGSVLQQARLPDGSSVAEHLADQISARNAAEEPSGLGLIGAVLGATQGSEAAALADRLPNSLLLVPGIGAQGATMDDVRAIFGRHYARIIPSVSRGIARAGPAVADLKRAVERLIAEARGA